MPSNSASDKWSWHAVGAIVLPAIVLAGCGSMEPPTGESNPPSESSKALLPTATTVESDAEAFEHEAGEVVSGEVLSHKFTYTNRRSVPIFIESQSAISHSCSCTMLDVEPWRLLPGESAQVAMEVRTRGKSGAVEETATVRWSGDPAGDWSSEFTLKASAAVLASATPAAVYMQSATPGQPLPRPEVVVRSKPPMDWSRVKLEVSNDLFSIERLSADDHELRLAVQCLPDESTEHYRATLYVSGAAANSTGGDRTQEDRISLEIPLHAYIPASLAVHPRTILAESMATAAPCRGDSWCWASRSSAASRSRRF